MNKLYKIVIAILVIIVINSNCLLGAKYIYEIEENKKHVESAVSTVAVPSFEFESYAQILMEPTTGKVLYSNNENEKMIPASVTKVMTILLLMEQIDSGNIAYTDMVTCSKKASQMGGSQIWFKEGEKLTIDEALKAICVVSANDVTVAISELIGGSEENFVTLMNEKAKELGMENTHFMNSHGITEEGHYTSAKDIAIMSRELITKHPNILKYTSIWMDSLRNGEFGLTNTNKLIRFYDGANGLKTGYTSEALYNLVATATRGNTTFLSVVLKAPSSDIRNEETKNLLDYGFANYEMKKICSSNAILDELNINKNINMKLETRIAEDIYILNEKGKNTDYVQNIEYIDNLNAPINEGDVIGKIQIIDKESSNLVNESDILANYSINKSSIDEYIDFICKKLFLIV